MKLSKKEKYQLVARYHNGESISDICTETGVPRSTLYTWLKPYKTTYTDAGYAVSSAEFVKMKKAIEKLEQKIEVLQKVNCTVSSPLKEKLRELSLLHGQYSVHVLCEALKVSRGTFYNHIFRNKGDNNSYQIRKAQLSERIKQIYEDNLIGTLKFRLLSDFKQFIRNDGWMMVPNKRPSKFTLISHLITVFAYCLLELNSPNVFLVGQELGDRFTAPLHFACWREDATLL